VAFLIFSGLLLVFAVMLVVLFVFLLVGAVTWPAFLIAAAPTVGAST
jgi:hypothetical protein